MGHYSTAPHFQYRSPRGRPTKMTEARNIGCGGMQASRTDSRANRPSGCREEPFQFVDESGLQAQHEIITRTGLRTLDLEPTAPNNVPA